MMAHDPTRAEMLAWLATQPLASESDDFDRESAVYWFAANYHSGQWSNLYAALCESPYQPGICERAAPEGVASFLYYDLVHHYTGADHAEG